MLLMLAAFLSSAPEQPSADTITDAGIAAFAAVPLDKEKRREWKRFLGFHNGTSVVVDYPCSDLCPDYTTRIIHYAVDPGPECDRIGGVVRNATVPRGIGSIVKPFCVPAVLGTELIPLGEG